jgi:hypothetical protein
LIQAQAEGRLPYHILDNTEARDKQKQFIYELFKQTLKTHMISFSRSTRGDFRNSLFDMKNTEMSKQRKEYIIELLAVCLDNVMEFHIAGEFKSDKTKEGFKTAVYRTSLYMSEWFNGKIIQEILKDKATDEEIRVFCESYGVSSRMHTAIGNIKSCEKAVLDIFNNYKETLSNQNIAKVLKAVATPEEIKAFCESYGVGKRMYTAIINIKSCEKAVLEIFAGRLQVNGKMFYQRGEGTFKYKA